MNVRKKKIRMTAMAGVALLAASCSIGGHHGNGDDNFFSAFTTFDDAQWIYADGIEYVVDTLKNRSASGDFVLTLRHTPAYEYSNIWLEVDYNLDEGGGCCDTFNIVLADDYGRWRGKGTGASFCISDTIIRNVPLQQQQRIRLRHIMRTDTLHDIELIGLTYLPDNN